MSNCASILRKTVLHNSTAYHNQYYSYYSAVMAAVSFPPLKRSWTEESVLIYIYIENKYGMMSYVW